MAGLDPAIHDFLAATPVKTWMPGTSPGMTSLLPIALAPFPNARVSSNETERDAAKIERIARHRAAPRLGGIAHLGDIGHPKRQAAHDLACCLDKAEAAIGQLQLSLAIRILGNGNPDDPAPVLVQPLRLRTFHLDANQSLCHML